MDVETRKPRKKRRLLKLLVLLVLVVVAYVAAARAKLVHLSTPLDFVLSIGMTEQHGNLLAPRDGSQHLVLLVHGMGVTKWSLWKAERILAKHDYEVWNESYDCSAGTIPELAADFARRLEERLAGLGTPDRPLKLYAVAHSMGGLILRAYLEREDARSFERLVFFGTPNHGAVLAAQCRDSWWYKWLYGTKSSYDLVPGSAFLRNLGVQAPPHLGCILGGRGDDAGYSSSIPGDDDGRVGVAEGHLEGEADSILLDHRHRFLVTSADGLYQMLYFITYGRFDHEPKGE